MDDLISRQAAIAVADSSDYVGLSVDDVKKVTDEVVKGLKRLPSAQPEQIARDIATIIENERDMRVILKNADVPDINDGDLISRQAAIDALADYIHNVDRVFGTGHLSADDCKDAATSVLEDIPSAQPEIIRCKDCIVHGVCRFEQGLGLDGYCSQAEREE